MLVLSHRGYHVHAPENTLEAFEQAVALGVDGIETDVRLTADGQAVLFHDRQAPNSLEIGALSRAELESLTGYPVPTLEEAIGRWKNILWNLEIKVPAAVAATCALIRSFRNSRRFIVSSFWHTVIEQIDRTVDVDTALLLSHRPLPRSWAASVAHRMPRVKTLVWNYEFLDIELLDESRQHGFRNFVYGVHSLKDHERLAAWPVEGVITDRPEFLKLAHLTTASAG